MTERELTPDQKLVRRLYTEADPFRGFVRLKVGNQSFTYNTQGDDQAETRERTLWHQDRLAEALERMIREHPSRAAEE